MSRFIEAQQAYKENDPPVEVNQRWVAPGSDHSVNRRIRILARYPDDKDGKRAWLYEEMAGGQMKLDIGRLGICPEFNLRFVFELEQ